MPIKKPKGYSLEYGKRADMSNLKDEDDIFNIDCFYQIERKMILNQIENEALKQDAKWETLKSDIFAKYINPVDEGKSEIDSDTMKKASSKFFEDETPTKKKVLTWQIIFWITVLLETTVLIVQGLFSGDFNPFIIVLAALLALGGFFQGHGVGKFFYYNWLTDKGLMGYKSKIHDWIMISLGSVLILLVACVRSIGSSDIEQMIIVFLITLFFGESVAFSEAMYTKYLNTRIFCLKEQEKFCRYHATRLHKEEFEKGSYEEYFKSKSKETYKEKIEKEKKND